MVSIRLRTRPSGPGQGPTPRPNGAVSALDTGIGKKLAITSGGPLGRVGSSSDPMKVGSVTTTSQGSAASASRMAAN